MTIESIVERGTLEIGRSPLLRMSGSPDIARFRNRFYSDKPPVLPAIGAAIYGPVYWSGTSMSRSEADLRWVNWLLVTSIAGGGGALAVASLRSLLQTVDVRPIWADALALGLGLGTLMLTYAVTFNNHAPAAGLIMATLALLKGADGTPLCLRRSCLAGFLAGLAATMDLPAGGLALVGFGILSMARRRAGGFVFGLGAVPPLILHVVLQSAVTGSPLPVEFFPEAFEYPGSYWTSPEGQFQENGSRFWFLMELLAGPQGFFTVTPVLALALPGLVMTCRRGPESHRWLAIWTLVALMALLAYYSYGVRRTDFSGQSFGTRHLLPMVPILYYWACCPLEWPRRRWFAPLFISLWLIGAIYAWQGAQQPWSRIERRSEPTLVFLQNFVLYPYTSYER